MSVKVATQGGEVRELEYYPDNLATVSDALKAAGLEVSEKATLSVNNEEATTETPVKDNDLVVVTPNISNG